MSTLYLLRHARAAWPQPGAKDFDRALEPSGMNDAAALGMRMAREGLFPQTVLCSTARRARDTLRELLVGMDTTMPVEFTDELYTRDVGGYVEIVRQQTVEGPLLIIGHNPMIEDAAMMLVEPSSTGGRGRLELGFPVCALAVIQLGVPFTAAEPGTGTLISFIAPPF